MRSISCPIDTRDIASRTTGSLLGLVRTEARQEVQHWDSAVQWGELGFLRLYGTGSGGAETNVLGDILFLIVY